MHTLARPPAREARLQCLAGHRAFTLIELLTVIAIIAILAGITFGVVKGVNERAAIGQAKSELAVLSQALESYKLQYGDYPQLGTNNATPATSSALAATHTQYYLFNALTGKIGPKLTAYLGKPVLPDLSRFSLEKADTPGSTTAVSNSILDPWGRRYMIYYRTNATGTPSWKHQGYILYSTGPDGKHSAPTDTAIDYNHVDNLDNLYANRN
jgi:prepilin-type N-terminal cleavage/methylation domain-containing protein